MEEKAGKQGERNYGIDALRLLAMFYIVILHVLGQGGVLNASRGIGRRVVWFMEIAAYCAVDCYALISGYVGWTGKEQKSSPRFSKYMKLWMQVFFYSFGITLIAFLKGVQDVGVEELITSAFPVASCQYWYFNAYTGVFFAAPWLNLFVNRCSEEELTRMVKGAFLLFSCYATAAKWYGDPFRFVGGYTFVWLLLLYLVGAWMKKCDIVSRMKTRYVALSGAACLLLTWVCKIWVPKEVGGSLLVSYCSPTIVLIAVFHVMLFGRMHIGRTAQKVIACFAPAAFGVYLIHAQKVIWDNVLKKSFVWIGALPVWKIPGAVLLCAGGIFIVCLLIEKVRLWLFQVLRIDKIGRRKDGRA